MTARSALLLIAIALTSRAQETPPSADPIIRVSTTLVQIQTLVTDSAGHHVATLSPSDFTLLEDGKPQRITHFSYVAGASGRAIPAQPQNSVAPPPARRVDIQSPGRAYAIVVDDLHTAAINLARIRPELKKFVDTEVRPDDLVSISAARGDMGVWQNFTTSKATLDVAVDRATVRTGAPYSQPGDCTAELIYFETTLNRLSSVIRTLSEGPGRKSAILMTDGLVIPTQQQDISGGLAVSPQQDCSAEGMRMNTDLRNLANQAVRAGVALYVQGTVGIMGITHDASWNAFPPAGTVIRGGPGDVAATMANQNIKPQALSNDSLLGMLAANAPQEVAEFLASQTGGYAAPITNDMTMALNKAIEDMSGYYLLGYEPAPEDFELKGGAPQWHRVDVRVGDKALTVRATKGFSGSAYGTVHSGPSDDVKQQIEEAFFSGGELNGLATRLRTEFFKEGDIATLTVTARVDLAKLPFRKEDNRSRDDLTLVVGVFDQDGNFISAYQKQIEMRLKDETLDTLVKTGFANSTDFKVSPGKYLVRLLVRDSEGKSMAKQSTGVDIPW